MRVGRGRRRREPDERTHHREDRRAFTHGTERVSADRTSRVKSPERPEKGRGGSRAAPTIPQTAELLNDVVGRGDRVGNRGRGVEEDRAASVGREVARARATRGDRIRM